MVDITDRQKTILRAAFEKMLKDLQNHEDGNDCGFAFPRRFASDITPDELHALVNFGLLEGDNAEPEQAYRITKRGERLVSGADYLMVGKSYRHDDQKVTVVESSRNTPGRLRVTDDETGVEKWVDKNDLKPLAPADPFAHLEAIRLQSEADKAAQQRERDEQRRAEAEQRQRVQAAKLKLALAHLGIEAEPTNHQITIADITFTIEAYDANGHISFALTVSRGERHDRLSASNADGDWTQAQAKLADSIRKLREPAQFPPVSGDDSTVDTEPVTEPTTPDPVTEIEMFNFDPLRPNGAADKIARYLNDGWVLFTSHVVNDEVVYVFRRTVTPEPEREAAPPPDPGRTIVSDIDKQLAERSRARRQTQPVKQPRQPDAIIMPEDEDYERQVEAWREEWRNKPLPEALRVKMERNKARMNQQLIDNMRRRQAERAGQT